MSYNLKLKVLPITKTGQWPRATASRYKGDGIKTFEKIQNLLNK